MADPYPHTVTRFRASPDGRAVAFVAAVFQKGEHLVTLRFHGDAQYSTVPTPPERWHSVQLHPVDTFFWTRDSKRVVVSGPDPTERGVNPFDKTLRAAEVWAIGDGDTAHWRAPPGYTLLDAGPGEKSLLAYGSDRYDNRHESVREVDLVLLDHTDAPPTAGPGRPTRLLGGLNARDARSWRLSPDGRLAAGLRRGVGGGQVVILDPGTRAETVLAGPPSGQFFGWSPDSRAVLYTSKGPDGLGVLVVQALDGEPRELPTYALGIPGDPLKLPNQVRSVGFRGADWR